MFFFSAETERLTTSHNWYIICQEEEIEERDQLEQELQEIDDIEREQLERELLKNEQRVPAAGTVADTFDETDVVKELNTGAIAEPSLFALHLSDEPETDQVRVVTIPSNFMRLAAETEKRADLVTTMPKNVIAEVMKSEKGPVLLEPRTALEATQQAER